LDIENLALRYQNDALVLLLLSQRRLNFEDLKLDLLNFLESADLHGIDFVAQEVNHAHEEKDGAADLKPMKRQCARPPGAVVPEERQAKGEKGECGCRDSVSAKRYRMLCQ
jgi:hypothetical protein